MKRFLLFTASLCLMAVSCNKPEGGDDNGGSDGVMPEVTIAVTDNADNQATVTAQLTAGQFYGAKIITGVRISDITIDYSKEIALIQYVEANGKDISELPYTEQLTDLIYHQEYMCAVIVYDETGRACDSAFDTFLAEGNPDGIAEDSSAGSLDDNNPML